MLCMELASIASILALALSVVALGVAIVTLRLQQIPPELSALQSKVNTLDLDLTELADRQNTWMRRDAARTARAGRELPAPASPKDRKAELRARFAAVRTNSQGAP